MPISVFPWELNPPHASTVSPHRSISFPGTSLTDLAQTTVMSRVASFELFERVFITKHHVAPLLLGVGLSEPQSITLVGFDSREALRWLNARKSRRCIVLCTVT